MTPTYCKLVDGGYLRLELITSKSTIQRAEQMTFTRGQLRRLITHFHKVVELVCQTGAAHKHWNNNDSNLLEKSHTMGVLGMKCFGWHFMRSSSKCYVRGEVKAVQVPGTFLGEMSSLTKKCMAVEMVVRCAWVTVQQMCRVAFFLFLWPAFCNDTFPSRCSNNIPS